LEFKKGVEEIFDVQILLGVRFPGVVGFDIQNTFIMPGGRRPVLIILKTQFTAQLPASFA
jgi:hypothetical protein